MAVRNIPLSNRRRGVRHGLRRPQHVSLNDDRSAMRRFLEDGQIERDANGQMVAPQYDQQWRTLWKAQRLGYVDGDQYLTDKGRDFLASDRK